MTDGPDKGSTILKETVHFEIRMVLGSTETNNSSVSSLKKIKR